MPDFLKTRMAKRVLLYLCLPFFMLVARHSLWASFPAGWLWGLTGFKLLVLELSLVPCFPGGIRKGLRILSACYTCLLGAGLWLCIVITPYSVYAYFFQTALAGFPGGETLFVANLFLALVALLMLIFGSFALRDNSWKPFPGWLVTYGVLRLFVHQNFPALLFFLLSLLILVFVLLRQRVRYLVGSLLLGFLVSGVIFLIYPEPEGSRFVNQILFPEVRRLIDTHFPDVPLLLDVPGYGLEMDSNRLGGRTVLTASPVFEVESRGERVVYLHTRIYNIFTGRGWQQSTRPAVPVQLEEPPETASIGVPRRLKVLCEVFPLCPLTNATRAFLREGAVFPVGEEDWPGIKPAEPLVRNDELILLERPSLRGEEAPPQDSPVLTGVISPALRELAESLGRDASGDEEVLQRILLYLAENYVYDLRAPVIEEGEDFLERFLFREQWGYCTHFATAFAVLAGLNGIPVRYATGYLVYFGDREEKRVVTGRSAHAWPEVLEPGKGWVVREATRAVRRDYYAHIPEVYLEYLHRNGRGEDIARNARTLRQLRDMLGIESGLTREEELSGGKSRLIPLSVATGLCLILFIIFGRRWLGRGVRRKRAERIRHPLRNPLNRLVRRCKEVPPPEEGGWLRWHERVCRVYAIDRETADTLLAIILKAAYNHGKLSGEESEFLRRFKP